MGMGLFLWNYPSCLFIDGEYLFYVGVRGTTGNDGTLAEVGMNKCM